MKLLSGRKKLLQIGDKKITTVSNYSAVAQIYPHIMRSIDYQKWAQYIYQIGKETKKKKIKALELASGTGMVAKYLSNKFNLLVATDISFSMLTNQNYIGLSGICCDMTMLPLKIKFDLIFSTFDSINYLNSKEKYFQLFKSVNSCLSDTGIFTFDVCLENNSIKYEKYLNRSGKINGIAYKQRSFYDRRSRIHYNHFQITLANGRKVEEIHKQKILRFEDYFDIIEKTDFYVSGCYNSFSFDNASEKSERIQFILKKKIYA